MPVRRSFLSPLAVRKINGIETVTRSARRVSRTPYPSSSGMETSQRMTSGNSFLARATPAQPFVADSGLKPSISSMSTRFSNVCASSSITRIFFIVRARLGLRRFAEQRQGDGEGRPFALDAREMDFAAMQGDATLNDEQAQARSGNLPHIAAAMERLEQPFLVGFGNAATVVGDPANRFFAFGFHHKVHGLIRRRVLHCVGQQVGEDVSQQTLIAARMFRRAVHLQVNRATLSPT